MTTEINTHGWRMPFGKHKDELITRVPVSYLKWMINEGVYVEHAEAELSRRGTTTPELDVTGHAIDRASLTCLGHWQESAHKDEGISSWLHRMCSEAMDRGEQDKQGRYLWNGLILAIGEDGVWPVLKTVFPQNEPEMAGGES